MIAIYSRKSVYTGKGESIENQVEMCKEYINNNLNSFENTVVFEDEGFSGKNIKRPKFQEMLKLARLKKFTKVICYRLDRISRSVSDFSTIIEELNDLGIAFISIKEQFDTSTSMGRAMMYIASVFAQLERETISERVRDNMLLLAKTGRWLGGNTPLGFDSEKTTEVIIDGKIKMSSCLNENSEEIEIVKLIYSKFLETRSMSAVLKYLTQNNIQPKRSKYFSLIGIKGILENPVYCIADNDVRKYFLNCGSEVCFEPSNKNGLLSYNKRNYYKKTAERQPKENWIISQGKHNGIIKGMEWVKVQEILEENKSPKKYISHNDYSLLSGKIYCGKCGSKMFAKKRHKQEKYDYICRLKINGNKKTCDGKNLDGKSIDTLVCNILLDYLNTDGELYKLLDNLKNGLSSSCEECTEDKKERLKYQIKKYNDEIEKLMNVLLQENLNEAFILQINDKVGALSEKIDILQNELQILELNTGVTEQESLEIYIKILEDFKRCFNDLSIYERRTFINLLIDKIVFDGEKLNIFIKDK